MTGDDDMYIALGQTNHAVTTLAENLTEREMVVDVSDAAKGRTTVDALHQVLAHLNALDPHVLKENERRIVYAILLGHSVDDVETIRFTGQYSKRKRPAWETIQRNDTVCGDLSLMTKLVMIAHLRNDDDTTPTSQNEKILPERMK